MGPVAAIIPELRMLNICGWQNKNSPDMACVQESEPKWHALRDIVKKYFRMAGVHGNKTPHSLRHTAITSAIRHGAPAEKVRGTSRHASLDTLMIYYHESDRVDNPAEQYISYK